MAWMAENLHTCSFIVSFYYIAQFVLKIEKKERPVRLKKQNKHVLYFLLFLGQQKKKITDSPLLIFASADYILFVYFYLISFIKIKQMVVRQIYLC